MLLSYSVFMCMYVNDCVSNLSVYVYHKYVYVFGIGKAALND